MKFTCSSLFFFHIQITFAWNIMQSLTNDPITMAVIMSSLLFVTGFLRNDYGELSRALVRYSVCVNIFPSRLVCVHHLISSSHPLEFSRRLGTCICAHTRTNKLCTERLPNSTTPKSDDSTGSTQTIPSRRRWRKSLEV